MNEKRYIGIDLGGTKIAAGLVDDFGNILNKITAPTLAQRSSDEIAADAARLASELIRTAELDPSDIELCGVGSPGIANTETDCIDFCSSLPFRHYPLAAKIRELTGIKHVELENDANAAALGEHKAGAAVGAKDSVMITLGTGIGGGIIINNKIYAGCNFSAGELGHIVIEHDGRKCKCGRNGCWEAYCSATGLVMTTVRKMLENRSSLMWELCGNDLNTVGGRTAFNAFYAGDSAAKEVIDEYISYLADGLANIINTFMPEILTIGGGISGEGQKLLDLVSPHVYSKVYSAISFRQTELKIAKLGNNAGIIGAAYLMK